MQPFVVHAGLVAPMDRSNIDTDAIISKPFLKSVERTGFGKNLFDDWRYLDPYVEEDDRPRREVPDFVLNRYPYRHASVLLSRSNFGCGSSREHAVWALTNFGIRTVVAESFSDIFYSNAIKNGLVPVVLIPEQIDVLFTESSKTPYYALTVDLQEKQVMDPSGRHFAFEIADFHRELLMQGWDEISHTLLGADSIANFEQERLRQEPWI